MLRRLRWCMVTAYKRLSRKLANELPNYTSDVFLTSAGKLFHADGLIKSTRWRTSNQCPEKRVYSFVGIISTNLYLILDIFGTHYPDDTFHSKHLKLALSLSIGNAIMTSSKMPLSRCLIELLRYEKQQNNVEKIAIKIWYIGNIEINYVLPKFLT